MYVTVFAGELMLRVTSPMLTSKPRTTQDLAEENNQLMEDNESLREEKTVLEETISELRYELDMKDVINDDV